MLFDRCKQCRKCCHIEAGFPPLQVPLLRSEKKRWHRLVIEDECRFLGTRGCSLGDAKPFACEQYPLSYDPYEARYFFDADCPLYEQYQAELAIPGSEAELHFQAVHQRIQTIMKDQPEFLQRNFDLDADYFELLPLAVPEQAIGPKTS